ncbi:TBC1 domain family member 15-like isoform X1 [Senna tora]|uniref:TBC1 domain family member 15-like isoform X1 n=1 Tax=Senna tora TaxID=362788 RepID=A0A834W579_9FABA|nr:TBC1 domain family member 15-like isoform X1 [Senna tora]
MLSIPSDQNSKLTFQELDLDLGCGSCVLLRCILIILDAGKTLSARRWHASFSQDGYLDIAKVLRRIQRGGVHPSIKGVVWEFLLGCYDPNSTFEERSLIKEQRRQRYRMWKSECQMMVSVIGSGRFIATPLLDDDGLPIDQSLIGLPISDKKTRQWMQTLHQIGLDVVRTDQALVFYETESNQAKLWDVLAVYAWMDNDIGYVRGMNDICSPMVILLDNEADSFWCFERAMRRMRENFRTNASSMGVQLQLSTLSQIMKTVDPRLHQHLEDLDGGEYLFAFRMLMVLFRREFSFVDTLYLWELMWAMEYDPNMFSLYEEYEDTKREDYVPALNDKLLKKYGKFQRKNLKTGNTEQQLNTLSVFLVASVLEIKNRRILKEAKDVDDVVKILGDITSHLDAKKACDEALKIHKKYLSKGIVNAKSHGAEVASIFADISILSRHLRRVQDLPLLA